MSKMIDDKEQLRYEFEYTKKLIENYDQCKGCQYNSEHCPIMFQEDENGICKCDKIEIAGVSLAAINKCLQIYFS